MQDRPRDDFAELYTRYWPKLVRLCELLLPDHGHDAEAVAQDAFVRAWKARGRFAAGSPFWPWLSTIARRQCIDYLRRAGRDERIRRRFRHQRAIAPPQADEEIHVLDDQSIVQQAIGSLTPRHRRLMRLHHVDGWTYEKIAAAENVTVDSVRGALKRARASLRASYEHVTNGLIALPGIAAIRRTLDRFLPWVARAGDVRPPAVAAIAVLLGTLLHAVAPPVPERPGIDVGTLAPGADSKPAAPSNPDDIDPSVQGATPPRATVSSDGAASPAAPTVAPAAAEGYHFESVAVAPNDELYAHGGTTGGKPEEGVLLRSRDGGRTWERLPAVGFLGGLLLFPPTYPADDRIFVTTPWNGIAVSKDGGATFLPLSTVIGLAAMSPDFSKGHEVFLSGNAQGWSFDASRMVTMPSGLSFPPSASWSNFAFGLHHAEDGIVYVGGNTVAPQLVKTGPRAMLYACRRSGCTEAARGGPDDSSAPKIVVSPVDGTVWAYARQSLWRSRDGSTFERIPLPASMVPHDLVVRGHATYLAMQPWFGRGGLFRSLDGGDTWQELAPGRFRWGPTALAALSDGTLFAAVNMIDGGGLLRSTDDGATWQKVL